MMKSTLKNCCLLLLAGAVVATTSCSKDYDNEIKDLQSQITDSNESTAESLGAIESTLAEYGVSIEEAAKLIASMETQIENLDAAYKQAVEDEAAARAEGDEAQADALAKAQEDIADQIDDLEAAIALTNSEVSSLTSRLETLETTYATLNSMYSSLTAQQVVNKNNIAINAEDIASLESALEGVIADLGTLETTLTESIKAGDDAVKEDLMNELDSYKEGIQEILADYEGDYANLKSSYEALVSSMQSSLEELIDDVDQDLAAFKSEYATKIAALEEEIAGKADQADVDALEEQVQDLTESYSRLEGYLEGVDLAMLADEVAKMDAFVEMYSDKIGQNQLDIAALQTLSALNAEKIEALEETLAAHLLDYDAFKESISEDFNTLDSKLTSLILALRKYAAETEKQISDNKDGIAANKDAISDNLDAIGVNKDAIAALEEHLGSLEIYEINGLRDMIYKLQQGIAANASGVADLKDADEKILAEIASITKINVAQGDLIRQLLIKHETLALNLESNYYTSTEIDEMKAALETELGSKIDKVATDLAQLSKFVQNIYSALFTARKDIESVKGSVKGLEDEVDGLSTAITDAQSQIDAVASGLATLTGASRELLFRVNAMEEQVDAHEVSINVLLNLVQSIEFVADYTTDKGLSVIPVTEGDDIVATYKVSPAAAADAVAKAFADGSLAATTTINKTSTLSSRAITAELGLNVVAITSTNGYIQVEYEVATTDFFSTLKGNSSKPVLSKDYQASLGLSCEAMNLNVDTEFATLRIATL